MLLLLGTVMVFFSWGRTPVCNTKNCVLFCFFPHRCLTWSSPMWRCACLSMCHMCSTPQWELVAGSTLTCSRSCGSRSCTTPPFCGRTASAAPRRPSFRVSCLDGHSITLFVSGIHNILYKIKVFGVIQCVFCDIFWQVRCTQPACVSTTRDVWW